VIIANVTRLNKIYHLTGVSQRYRRNTVPKTISRSGPSTNQSSQVEASGSHWRQVEKQRDGLAYKQGFLTASITCLASASQQYISVQNTSS
jgi:hypothetical protein